MAREEDRSNRTGALSGRRLGAVAVLLAASVLLSRIMGFVREMVLAARIGLGPSADAYYAAFQIPDLLNYLLAGGALAVAFTPLYLRTQRDQGDEAAQELSGDPTEIARAARRVLEYLMRPVVQEPEELP